MNEAQRRAIDVCRKRLAQDINYEQLKVFLLLEVAVDIGVFQAIEKDARTDALQKFALLETLKGTDKGWELLHEHFNSAQKTHLSDLLRETLEKGNVTERVRMTQSEIEKFVLHLQERLLEEYTTSVNLPYHLFQTTQNELFSESTYVTLDMVREQTTPQDSHKSGKERSTPAKQFGNISGNSQLLSVIYSGSSAMLVPLIILGQPGQGKTTFVHKLAYDWAMAQKGEKPSAAFQQISLLFAFPLRNLKGEHEDILDFLVHLSHLSQDVTPAKLVVLKEWIYKNPHKVLVILDGFDELNGKCAELEGILNQQQLPPIALRFPLIVTTRPYATPKASLRFEICQLTTKQVKEFVEKRAAGYPKTIVAELVAFCQAKENQFLLQSPLLLHLVCWVALTTRPKWDEESNLDLPRSQTQTYFAIIELMSKRRNEKRAEKGERFSTTAFLQNDFTAALSAFAFEKNKASKADSLVFDRNEVDKALRGRAATEEAMTLGLLVSDAPLFQSTFSKASSESDNDLKLSFAHKTFQEFFAAIYIVNQLEKEDGEQRVRQLLFNDTNKNPLKSLQQMFLFAMGVAFMAKPEKASVLLELVGGQILRVIDAIAEKYNGYDANFTLSFLKALSRETDEPSGRATLQDWANKNSANFDRFGKQHVEYSNIWKFGATSPILRLLESFRLFGVGFSSLRALNVFGSNFVYSITNGSRASVCEFAVPIGLVQEEIIAAEGKIIKVDRFRFDGTVKGLENYLRTIGVHSERADFYISVKPKRVLEVASQSSASDDRNFEPSGTPACVGTAPKMARHSFRTNMFGLSSSLGACEVKNAIRALSIAARNSRDNKVIVNFVDFFADADDERRVDRDSSDDGTQASPISGTSEASTDKLTTKIFVNNLNLTRTEFPEFSTFEAFLTGVQEIYSIKIANNALPLLDEWFQKRTNKVRGSDRWVLPRVHGIEYNFESSSSTLGCNSLGKIVDDFQAEKLEMTLDDFSLNASFKASFSAFCNALIEGSRPAEINVLRSLFSPLRSRRRENCLRELQIDIRYLSDAKVELLYPAIVDPLVRLLRSSRELRLKIKDNERNGLFDLVSTALPTQDQHRVIHERF